MNPSTSPQLNAKPRKRLFLGLLLALEGIIAVTLLLLWYVPYRGFETLKPGLSEVIGWTFLALLLFFSLGVIVLVATIIRGREMPGTKRLRGILVRYFFPLITGLGRLFGIPKDDIRRSFIGINNELVRSESLKSPPKSVLILMPHCVQRDICPYRITVDVRNCRQCGQCDFSELTQVAERLGVDMTVATGGTLARRVVIETRPELIVGVACERDLSSGIVDTYPIPVLGVLIDRPEGPCLNTQVNVGLIKEALEHFLPKEVHAEKERAGQTAAS
ncbi:MAG: DUF116 domain-containing protein [bacterium]|nr:MAG: DUF116 domain-containing protein [bacterium]